jgi:hypothetical protein
VRFLEALQAWPTCSVNPCSVEILEVMVEAYEISGAFQSLGEFIYFLSYSLFHVPTLSVFQAKNVKLQGGFKGSPS